MSLIRRIKNTRRLGAEFDWSRKPPDLKATDGPHRPPSPHKPSPTPGAAPGPGFFMPARLRASSP